jgi:type I restriction enzyme S subunit
MSKHNGKKTPKDWQEVSLGDIGVFSKGAGIGKNEVTESGHNAVRYGELYTKNHFHIRRVFSHIPNEVVPTTKQIQYGDILFAGSGETIDEIGKSAAYLLKEPCYAGGDIIVFTPKDTDSLFLSYFLNVGDARKKLRILGQGQSVVHVYKSDIEKITLHIPPLPEQKRIVKVLETWDRATELVERKIALTCEVKKGVMQRLLTGKVRLPGFRGEWKKVELGRLLKYEQPIAYLVQSTDYDSSSGTPVLTANKSFVLGYTDESEGIYSRCPAIIFDDFTTDSKYVDFHFKVKSSAIKILTPATKEVDLRYMFERMQLIRFNVGDHRRHWISVFQDIAIEVPDEKEQVAIGSVCDSIEQNIKLLRQKLALLKDQKKYLLNNLVTGVIRTPEKL